MANSVSPTTGTLVAIAGGGLGFALQQLLGEGTHGRRRGDRGRRAASTLLAAGARRADGPRPARPGPRRRAAADPRRPYAGSARGLVDGARHVLAHRPAGHALAAIGAHRFFYGVSTIAAILLFRNYFNDPDDVDAGLAGLADGVRGVRRRVLRWRRGHARGRPSGSASRRWIVVCFALAAAVEAVLVVLRSPSGCCSSARSCSGVAAQGSKICVDTIVQDVGRRRVPRPGVLVLRRAVQRRVRVGRGVRRR